jgi:predicted permease
MMHDDSEAQRQRAFYGHALRELRAIPGVDAAGAVSFLPMSGVEADRLFEIEGRPTPPGGEQPDAQVRIVTGGYFAAIGTPLLRGRVISDEDVASSPSVAVVNASFASRFFERREALDRRIQLDGRWYSIVGIAADVREFGLDVPPPPIMYFAFDQIPRGTMTFILRSARSSSDVARAAADAVGGLDAQLPVYAVRPLRDLLAASLAQRRFALGLLGSLASVALVLAAIGLYGVLAYTVAQRTREIGVRMALGANARGVLALILGESARVVGIGLSIGIAAALVSARFISSLLYGIGATDPAAFAASLLVLALAAALASLLPARRATRVDPVIALRAE